MITVIRQTRSSRRSLMRRPAMVARSTVLGVLLALLLSVSGVFLSATPARANDYYSSITEASAANVDWMSRVPDGTNLAWLSVPGTHDSLALCGDTPDPDTGQCSGIVTSITQTQENHGFSAKTLTTQFDAGIRALDIRVRVDKGDEGLKFTVHHGATYQYANFTDVLNATYDFLSDHPGETVLMNLKAECTGSTFSCKDADGFGTDEWRKKIFDSYLDGRSYTGDGDESTPSTAWRNLFWGPSVTGKSQSSRVPTLGEVRGKVVLLGYRNTGGGIFGGYGLEQPYPSGGSNEEYVQDDFELSTISDIDDKWEKVRAHLRRTNGTWDGSRPGEKDHEYEQDALYLNYTSGSGAGVHPYTVAGGTPTATGVNNFLIQCLRAEKERCPEFYAGRDDRFGGRSDLDRMGVMMMDFPGGGLIDEIIARNSVTHTDIRDVMVVGDSISHGYEGDRTWRYRLWDWARSKKWPVTFVGPYRGTVQQTDAQPPRPPVLGESGDGEPTEPGPGDPRVQGEYAGDVNAGFSAGGSAHYALWGRSLTRTVPTIKPVMQELKAKGRTPDLLLVELGFNDIGWYGAGADLVGTMKKFVDNARAVNPDVRIVLANVPQRTTLGDANPGLPQRISDYNAALAKAAPGWSTSASPVELADLDKATGCDPKATTCATTYDGLHPNALGEYRIAQAFGTVLHKEFGIGAAAPDVPDSAPGRSLATPSGMKFDGTQQGVTATWNKVFGAHTYDVQWRDVTTDSNADWQDVVPGVSAPRYDMSWQFTDQPYDGHTYEVRVRAVAGDGAANRSSWSSVVRGKAAPTTAGRPPGLTATAGAGSIDVRWSAPTDSHSGSIVRYAVWVYDKSTPMNHSRIIGYPASARSARITGVTAGHEYVILVCAWNASGEGKPSMSDTVVPG
ncbi:phosphatidylinositol-specific phospholipase C domain-containing protein [Streptomyces sp. NPDC057052]|uniref:phosphatidylinositol-specific phospholipase C domain-containing protein n=1 Tax=Streptomyces sp. NPDC057052 TaxID=3346010 RepID=UPI003631B43C